MDERRQRRSIRLPGYDYSAPGAYFVTVCAQDRLCLFGEIVDGQMVPSAAGVMIEKWFLELQNKHGDVRCVAYVVMPNHVHAVILVVDVGADLRVRPALPGIVQWFKTMTTNEYLRGVKTLRWPPIRARLWQRNYYEHVIRNDEELDRILLYIAENPARWAHDSENPGGHGGEGSRTGDSRIIVGGRT
jgi:REP element-mobilizing transposase RayT